MDPSLLMDEFRSLHVKLDSMTETLDSLNQRLNDIDDQQQVGDKTVRKSANLNIIIRFLTGLQKLSPQELRNTLVEANRIVRTANPVLANQNEMDSTINNDRLKTLLKDVFDLLNSFPLNIQVDANNHGASTSFGTSNNNNKLPPLEDSVEKVGSSRNGVKDIAQDDVNGNTQNDTAQNNVNDNTQNDVNDPPQNDVNDVNEPVQNDVNDPAQNDLNDKTTYTLDDIIQNEDVYELFKTKLKNSPYEDPVFKNNVRNSTLTLTLCNGETIVRPVRHVAPLIVLKKCDDLCPIPLQIKKATDNHEGENFPSTSKMHSNKINDSNSNNTTAKMTKRETRSSKRSDVANSFNTNVKTSTPKRRSTTKNSKQQSSKKKKN